MFVPIILGSDKTTVSVATGQHDYYPLYILTGSVQNSLRRAHGDAISLVGFLSIPKSKSQYYTHSINSNMSANSRQAAQLVKSIPRLSAKGFSRVNDGDLGTPPRRDDSP